MFTGEFCEISKNTFFPRTPPVAASGITDIVNWILKRISVMQISILQETGILQLIKLLMVFQNIQKNTMEIDLTIL